MKLTLRTVMDRCRTEVDAYLLLEELRWHGEPVCAHCGHDKAYFLKPANGQTRATGPKKTMSVRRVWKCAKCRKQFSVLTNTIFHGTKISLRTWLLVLIQVSSAKNGISAREVERMHGITAETAWFMLHRIREAMSREPLVGMLSGGTIVADETYIGGKPKNFKNAKRRQADWRKVDNKTAVLSLVHKETGEVRSKVVPNVQAGTLRAAITEDVDLRSVVLHTDTYSPYTRIGYSARRHSTVNHAISEYVRDGVSTNMAESYFAQLKRSIDGTYHHVSKEHLHRYLAEFDYRWSTRKMTDTDRVAHLIGRTRGRRLTYRPLAP